MNERRGRKSIEADGARENKEEGPLHVFILTITKARSAVYVYSICWNEAEGTDIIKLYPGSGATP